MASGAAAREAVEAARAMLAPVSQVSHTHIHMHIHTCQAPLTLPLGVQCPLARPQNRPCPVQRCLYLLMQVQAQAQTQTQTQTQAQAQGRALQQGLLDAVASRQR